MLIVVIDTARGDRLSVNGYDRPTTPRLDEFARDAVVFRDAWSPSHWTPPAHASLFTGLRPESHGYMNEVRSFLPESADTLADRFARAGYATAAFVNNPFLAPENGCLQGFEDVRLLYERVEPGPKGFPTATKTSELAATWVAAQDRPWFLFLNLMDVHSPYVPGEQDRDAFVRGDPPAADLAWSRTFDYRRTVLHNFGGERIPPRRVALLSDLYDADIAQADRGVGALLDALRKNGALDRTAVVITSDHGENLDEHGLLDHMVSLYRTVLHVPLVIRFPGVFDGGRTETGVARLEDVAPTVLELAGLPAAERIDGRSLTDLAQPRVARATAGRPVTLFSGILRDHPDWSLDAWDRSLRSVYDGRYHLIVRSDDSVSLFDVVADPLEQVDLAPTEPDVLRRMRPLLPVR